MSDLTDASFVGLPADGATGEKAWGLTQPEVEGLAPPPTELLRVNAGLVSRNILGQWEAVAREGLVFQTYFHGPIGDELKDALARTPRRAHATFHASVQYELHDPQRRSQALLQEGGARRTDGLYWLDTLERARLAPTGRAAAIREGSGHIDLAADLQALATLLGPRLSAIAALQAVQAEHADADQTPPPSMTADDVARMSTLGTQLTTLLSGKDLTRPWHAELAGALILLEQGWSAIHNAWSFHRRRTGGEPPPSFYSLGRG